MPLTARVLFGLFLFAPLLTAQAIDPRDRDFWNGKFSNPETKFNRQPSHLLVDAIHGRQPDEAIDLGMGEGRNALYLARQGWQTTGVDLSDIAVAQARKRAEEGGLKLNAVVDDLDHFDLGRNRWGLIALFYVHACYNGASPRSTQRINDALKPGGLLVIEGFAGKEEFLFKPNQLLKDFAQMRILRYEDVQHEADWAPGHESHIIRVVAEKSL